MALMPGGDWLYALNEDSDSIVAFRVDAASGALARMPGETRTGSPVCMVFGGAQA
ncbi:beta-propeller fold lactonase family protein [Achromobacter xylosoxidans]